jgi:hypothetical protein
MTVRKRSYSLDPRAAEYLDRRAKKLKKSASAVLNELVVNAAQQEREVQRWLKKLGAA